MNFLIYELGPCPGKGHDACGTLITINRAQPDFLCAGCDKKISIKSSTFWEGSHLTFSQGLQLIYYFQIKITQSEVIHEVEIGSLSTIVEWYSKLREIPGIVLANLPTQQIGGSGQIVDLDESHIRARKYDIGRILVSQAVCVFGGICRNTNECFLIIVEYRDASTLFPLIQKHIAPVSIIFSDMWRSYSGISDLLQIYVHVSINYSENFIDPDFDFLYAQTIERMWESLKRSLPLDLTDQHKGLIL